MSSNTGADEGEFVYDCIVVGSGHAGSCAALSAVEHGCRPERVLIVEKAPEEWVGGNGCVLPLDFHFYNCSQYTQTTDTLSRMIFSVQILHSRSPPNRPLRPVRHPPPRNERPSLPVHKNRHGTLHPRYVPLRHPPHVSQPILTPTDQHRSLPISRSDRLAGEFCRDTVYVEF